MILKKIILTFIGFAPAMVPIVISPTIFA
jgi:hypothetical protein